MSNSKINPEKIKSPMQLMAAWFVMLSILVGILLASASQISEPKWVTGYLVISSTILILIVIGCVLLMLTKYRPHLQDSGDYAVYLKDTLEYGSSSTKERELTKPVELSLEVGESVEDKIDFLKKARLCNVNVVNAPGCEELVYDLNRDGFSAQLYAQPQSDGSYLHKVEDATGIWVGENLEADVALRVIEISRKRWPQLKYLYLPSDANGPGYLNEEVFIGGSESAIKRIGLAPWSEDELAEIDKNISIDEFHSIIRGKYS